MKKMPQLERRRAVWWGLLSVIIGFGLLSRLVQTGSSIFDKYLGDALYAAMVYVLFRLTGRFTPAALWTALTMTAIELFQLTGIAAGMLRSNSAAARICARLMGTDFSFADLLAYAVGIACIAAVVHRMESH